MAPYRDRPVVIGIRPEDLSSIEADEHNDNGTVLRGTVDLVESLGSEKLVHFRLDAESVGTSVSLGVDENSQGLETGEITSSVAANGAARVGTSSRLRGGDEAQLHVNIKRIHLFDPDQSHVLASPGSWGFIQRPQIVTLMT